MRMIYVWDLGQCLDPNQEVFCNITIAAPMPFLLENSEKYVSDMIMFSYHPKAGSS